MIEREHKELSIRKQADLLSLTRSGLYYKPRGEKEENLKIMLAIDKLHIDYPYYGQRRITHELQKQGYKVGRKLVSRLMKKMCIEVLYPRPKFTEKDKSSEIYPYLLRGLEINRPNQVWETDITYIPMQKGYMYLMAIIDVYSRYVVGWGISNSLEAQWCKELMEETIRSHGKPEIVNTDQGSQFTSKLFTNLLKSEGIQISMDGKGRAIDNIYIERLWRSVKQENVYLYAYETGLDLYKGLKKYFEYYNKERGHQSLDYQTPEKLYKKIS